MTEIPTYHGGGSRIGDYIIEFEIGRGGMGVVYRAHKADTGEVVALKLMLPELVANPEYRERFVREAELGPNLDHPNIVPIFDSGEADGQLFIAMRLVEGRDLKEVIKQEGKLDPRRVLSILRQTAAALDAAHEAGVVHRDVKPQNILLSTAAGGGEELIYVSDFGLVKPVGSESHASRTGQILGSIQYMSPELVEGMAADGRADVYSLGCVLYECLTGRIPFDRPNEVAVLWAHIHEDPPRVSDACPELPGGIDIVIGNALAKHPDDRFLTCGEMVAALESGLQRKSVPLLMPVVRPLIRRASRRKTEREVWAPNYFPELSRVRKLTERTNWVQVTAVTAILALLAASLVQFGRDGGIPQAAADLVDLVQEAGEDVAGAISAGSRDEDVAAGFERAGASRPRAASNKGRTVSGGSPRSQQPKAPPATVSGPPGRTAAGPAPAAGTMPVAPGTPKIVWVSSRDLWGGVSDLWVMRANGLGKTRLTNTVADERWPDWSPDGTKIAYVRSGDIWVMNADGSEQHALGLCSPERPCSEPDWSPDGNKMLYSKATEDVAATESSTSTARIFVVQLASRDVDRVPRLAASAKVTDGSVYNASWGPNGRLIAGSCQGSGRPQLCVVRPNGTLVRRWGHSTVSVAFSPDGATIAGEACQGGGQGTLCLTRRQGSGFEEYPAGNYGFDPSWSDDGAGLAYADLSGASKASGDIYRVDLKGSPPLRLTNWPDTTDIQPDWWGPAS